MSIKRYFSIGTAVGTTFGIINLLIVYLGKSLFSNDAGSLPFSFLATILVGGALLGTGSMLLSLLTSGVEKTILSILFSIALAALIVLLGRYGNHSMVPLAIYVLAISNGLVICRLTSAISRSIGNTPSFHAG